MRARLRAEGYDAHDRSPGHGLYLADMAPESDGSTEPGSAWDEECAGIISAIRDIVIPFGASAEWADDDIVITPDDDSGVSAEPVSERASCTCTSPYSQHVEGDGASNVDAYGQPVAGARSVMRCQHGREMSWTGAGWAVRS